MSAKPRAFDKFPASLKTGYGPYQAVINRVHDGDSVLAQVSVGLDAYVMIWVRLRNVRAPELSQPGGKETRDYLASLLPYETPVRLTTEKAPISGDEQRTFERFVGVIEDQRGSINDRVQQFVKENNYPPGR